MHVDPMMPKIVGSLLGILLVGLVLKKLGQPTVVGYIASGILLGPFGLGLLTDTETISRFGGLGLVLLLFYIGMEMSLPTLLSKWRIAVLGTAMQVLISVACVGVVGKWYGWNFQRIVLLGFVISLSSTAIIIKILQDAGEVDSNVGRNVISILLAQDVIVIAMLIVVQFMRGFSANFLELGLQAFGAVGLVTVGVYLTRHSPIHLPFLKYFQESKEIQVFASLIMCFGMATIVGLLGLSAALGAFAAGIIVSAAKETNWIHHSLEPFRVLFIALFFVSIGMQLDLAFLKIHILKIGMLVWLVLVLNTFINAVILRLLGENWRDSLYAGALLSQIGEFSFVLAAVGKQAGIITSHGYQLALATIVMTLLLTVFWVLPVKRWYFLNRRW